MKLNQLTDALRESEAKLRETVVATTGLTDSPVFASIHFSTAGGEYPDISIGGVDYNGVYMFGTRCTPNKEQDNDMRVKLIAAVKLAYPDYKFNPADEHLIKVPKFKCPVCGSNKLYEVLNDCSIGRSASPVGKDRLTVTTDDNIVLSAGDVGRYQCGTCFHQLVDDNRDYILDHATIIAKYYV